MRAIVCVRLGDDDQPETLEIEDRPDPAPPKPGEALIRSRAWGVNFVDVLMCRGGYQLRPDAPFVPGLEASGEVLAVGDEVEGLRPGDRVISQHRPGAFQEMHVVDAATLWPAPDGFSYAEAATFRSGAMTAYHSLIDRGHMLAGETVLIHGATGGVGLAAVQLAKAFLATVIATGANPDKLDAVKRMGADHVLSSAPGFRDQVKDITEGRGVDLVYDPVGGDVFDESVRCLAWEGRIIVVGFVSGRPALARTNHLLIKGASVVGVRAGEGARRNPERGARAKEALLQLAADGMLTPHISHRFDFDEPSKAFRAIDAREVIGKAVLTA